MKGNTIVRKMRKLSNISADCMEALKDMSYDHTTTKKEIHKIVLIMRHADKKWDNICKHNIPKKARIELYSFFNECDDTPQYGMGV